MSQINTRSPVTEDILKSYPETTPAELEAALARANRLFEKSRVLPRAEMRNSRKATLLKMADHFDTHLDSHAKLITEEMGKTLKHSREEVKKCASTLRVMVEDADRLFAPRSHPRGDGFEAHTEWDPLGTLYAIMPWNFPYWQAIRAFAPSYLLGNSFLLKHASIVTGSALQLQKAFQEAGGEAGAFEILILSGEKALTPID
ncbi:MAG: aldehyde dehydrogenase family protein, partial [Proteobacteria bacterium]